MLWSSAPFSDTVMEICSFRSSTIVCFEKAQPLVGAVLLLINVYWELLAFDSCYTGENLTLDSLEQGTTTSRDVAHLVGQTELVDTSYRVATTDQRECTLGSCLGDSLTDSAATSSEVVALEYTGRTVPQDGLGTLDGLAEVVLRSRTCVNTLETSGNLVGRAGDDL